LNKEVEILKIGSIIPTEGRDTIMVVFDGGTIFDHYVSILKEKCGDEYKYLKTQQSIVGTPSDRPDRFSRFDKPSNTLKGIQNKEPKIGESYGVVNWYTSTVIKIIDDNILITRNSVYAIHDISKLRDKILNDLGIN
jgi:hypothetical protein